MTGSYPFNYESYYNGPMTDWGSIFSIYFFSLFDGLGLEIHLLINSEKRSLACVRLRKNTYSIWSFDIVLSDSNEDSPLASCKARKTIKPCLLRLFCKQCF